HGPDGSVTPGRKTRVISGVADHRPGWLGIVDGDEWGQNDIEKALARSPHLKSLPRFCIESYFCHPTELWAALPQKQRSLVNDNPQALEAPIFAALPDWVAHGAMWRVLRQLYQAARLPSQLENEPVTDETEIRRILQNWHERLSPDSVIEQYRLELEAAKKLAHDEQLMRYIHGKKFYNQVVVQVLDRLFSGKGADDWLQKFRDAEIQPPPDLRQLLDWVLSLV
ncbi:MAG: hypothetical protein AAB217_09390, partial [Chloroflexota bacterium]